jgi:hypothetical protein
MAPGSDHCQITLCGNCAHLALFRIEAWVAPSPSGASAHDWKLQILAHAVQVITAGEEGIDRSV